MLAAALLGCVMAGSLSAAGAGPPATPEARRPGWLRPVETTVEGVPGRVFEANLPTLENPNRLEGRTITVHATILAADSGDSLSDPVLVFQGGPGQSSSELAGFYAQFFARVRRHRDIILLDQRGTGRSNPLRASFAPERLFDDLGSIIPSSWVAPTLAALRDSADLTQYTTTRIVADADRLLDALGYGRVNLYGTSYGSRCALAFMKLHPERVRTAVIKNVLPPRAIIPLSYAANARRAMNLLFGDIAADSAARSAYPDLPGQLKSLLRRLQSHPVRVRVENPVTQRPEEVELTRAGAAMTLRMLLMSPQSRATIPYAISRAASDSFADLAAQMVQLRVAYARSLAMGMAMSVIASEDCPRITPELVERDTSGSFLGDAAVATFRPVCETWPRAPVDSAFFEPARVDVPTLLVSGRLDPATPPEWGEEVARELPKSAHVVFPDAAHPNTGFTGLDRMVADFIDRGSVEGLDLTPPAKGPPIPFRLPER
jgi:pimeloyl-ACP methyl ester carboxylesterase